VSQSALYDGHEYIATKKALKQRLLTGSADCRQQSSSRGFHHDLQNNNDHNHAHDREEIAPMFKGENLPCLKSRCRLALD
jgi:hypothetical protein